LAYIKFGFSFYTILLVALFSLLLVMAMIDFDIKEIPNGIILAILFLGALSFIDSNGVLWWEKLIGLIVMSGPFFIIGFITGGLGGGDIKLLFAAGLFLGWKLIVLGGLLGVIIGGFLAVILLVMKHAGRKSEMPLGPSLALGFIISSLWGNEIINWYINLF
jgi:leader peptidase (prepilin peptidase)/N-methyltransferase